MLSFLYVYSDHSILECYNLFSGVELSMRSFFVISESFCPTAKGPKYREPCKVDWDKNLSLLCEAVDQYALRWVKWKTVDLSVLSSWKEMVKSQIEERISKLKQNFKQPTGKVLQNADVKACLSDLHNKYVFVPADKAPTVS